MTLIPFVCLFIGSFIGLKKSNDSFLKGVDRVTTFVLILLMLTIGTNIGANDSVMYELDTIGINCVVIALCAIVFSVLGVWIIEKTILPLEKIQKELSLDNLELDYKVDAEAEKEKKTSPLVFIMPASIVIGIIIGFYILPKTHINMLDNILTGTLIVLYVGVGISIGSNKDVLKYIKVVGLRVVYISIAIFLGSLIGGFVSGIIMDIPFRASVISASGMSYYSITGAYMTKVYGIEIGTYGFMVNVMREFFTVLLLPILIKISKGSPIAGGAAGNMDTMLMPVTKFVGAELGLITLITGTILTFAVPFILPILHSVL
ncbi:lysine exporter LysO family protein [Clostridium aminobutyricum]|uniref:Lysine exporter LysO family protein n=1 Tax=Clostridium aminobutyricum TaxID=33953 RepID=A0A939D6Z3_CLOAM|nr:lysine exporter LysO family protein [Clostridium aminobutyricum]MBN7771983.1 lysine exporter LysO family protein [Clostridium aminobutyricum]